MKQTKLFGKSRKTISRDEPSTNAQLLIRGGFIDKVTAGVYTYLPLGYRVIKKLEEIIRQEMDGIGGQEVFMPALQPKSHWDQTGRWKTFNVLFKVQSQTDQQYALGPTHEEIVVPLAKKMISSYRDLPLAVYQIQTKFRDELRSKSGLLRGREFLMKDLYSFHTSAEDLDDYYKIVIEAYKKIFRRLELEVIVTEASGGTFSEKYSHEFQILTPAGEDVVVFCPSCHWAQNKDIAKPSGGQPCPSCHKTLTEQKSIEAANIFDLGTKFSKDFGLTFKDKQGQDREVVIGCYGMGVSRLMGAVVEAGNDQSGVIWPKTISPYQVHLLSLGGEEKVADQGNQMYLEFVKARIDVLHDDRDLSAGKKLTEADLIGISLRAVVSEKTGGKIEIKNRKEKEGKIYNVKEAIKLIQQYYA